MLRSRAKLIFSILLATIILLIVPNSAIASWTKFPGNPILPLGENNAWDSQGASGPCVLFNGSEYKMWYHGHNGNHWSIGYATSRDGVTWNKYVNNPVLDRDAGEKDVNEASVLFNGEFYEMWYTSEIPSDVGRWRIRYATSPNGITWTKYKQPVLQATEPWESDGVATPRVIKDGVIYKMWYAGRTGGGLWRIGYATSTDGINWKKYSGNPILSATKPWEGNTNVRPHVILEDNEYSMWYQAGYIIPTVIGYATSPDGINWIKPDEGNPVLKRGPQNFDKVYIAAPFVLKIGEHYYMWYSGYDGSRWQVGLASTGPFPPPSPPPPSKPSLVLLPGLGASWNYEKIFLGKEVAQSQWKMTPFVKHYNNLIATLDAADYTLNEDLFVFNYDWTKPVSQIADDLKRYIDEVVDPPGGQSSGKKIKLIGHSLGGLVGRAYIQENPGNHQVSQLITLGSPHKGVVQVYKAWEGADFHGLLNPPMRLGAELLLALRGREYKNKVEALRKIVPSLKDLLFIDDYLKKHPRGKVIPEKTYSQRNRWLKNLKISEELKGLLDTIVGEIADTLRWLRVVRRSKIDRKLGRFEDGRPVGEEFEIGDKTVLAESAGPAGVKTAKVTLDHSDLVRTKEGIKTILSLLGMEEVSTVVGSYPPDSPLLVFALASPGNLRVTNPLGQRIGFDISPPTIPHALFLTEEKMVVILGAIDGDYKVEVVGDSETGPYRLVVGQLTEKQDIWREYQGEIAPSETDTYTIGVDSTLETTPLDLARLIRNKLKNLLIDTAKGRLSFRKKVRLEGKITKILVEFEPVEILLQLKRNKAAQTLTEKALLDSLSLAKYLERRKAVFLLDSVREIINDLDQLHQLLSS